MLIGVSAVCCCLASFKFPGAFVASAFLILVESVFAGASAVRSVRLCCSLRPPGLPRTVSAWRSLVGCSASISHALVCAFVVPHPADHQGAQHGPRLAGARVGQRRVARAGLRARAPERGRLCASRLVCRFSRLASAATYFACDSGRVYVWSLPPTASCFAACSHTRSKRPALTRALPVLIC